MLKKAIAIVSVSAIMITTAATSVMAYISHNKYNANYSYSETGNEMTFNLSGGTIATSTGGTSVSYSRYIEVAVAKVKASSNEYISGNENSATVNQSGIGTNMSRNKTDTTVYYRHKGLLKPSETVNYTIDSFNYRIYQRSDIPNYW